jgi:hypothetical protein
MKVYTEIEPAKIVALKGVEKWVRRVSAEEGLFEATHKLHKWCVQDGLKETVVHDGVTFVVDHANITFKEQWQIPVPHTVEVLRVTTVQITPELALVVEEGEKTLCYFTANHFSVICEFLKKL